MLGHESAAVQQNVLGNYHPPVVVRPGDDALQLLPVLCEEFDNKRAEMEAALCAGSFVCQGEGAGGKPTGGFFYDFSASLAFGLRRPPGHSLKARARA